MESPVVPRVRTRLTQDYTSNAEFIRPSPLKGMPQGFIDESSPRTSTSMSQDQNAADLESPTEGRRNFLLSHGAHPTSPIVRNTSGTTRSGIGTDVESDSTDTVGELRKLDFSLGSMAEDRSYESSINTTSHATKTSGITTSSATRLPDFFAPQVFQVVLHNPTTAYQLLIFSRSRLAGENMEFLRKVEEYSILLEEVAKNMSEIHRKYLSVNAPSKINLGDGVLLKVNRDLKSALVSTLPKLEVVFNDSQNTLERFVAEDIYPRFVRHQLTASAVRALATDRSKYAGLGDCFVLSDPSKADNPLVFVSDGFVKVTGYDRREIIPRNCRFLQCQETDRTVVDNLRKALDSCEECVQLLLNQKKNGEPFWNLLYMTPLFDSRGEVVFFLGGQINCSTTIHSTSDVLQILAMSDEADEEGDAPTNAPEVQRHGSRASKILAPFRGKSQLHTRQRAPGMENELLNKIDKEKMTLQRQVDTFYTAYSKVLCICTHLNFPLLT